MQCHLQVTTQEKMINTISAILRSQKNKCLFMKKGVMLAVFRFSLLFTVFYLFKVQAGFSQDCKTQAANKPSSLVRSQDSYFDFVFYTNKPAKWNVSKMKSQLSIAENWIKNKLTGFTGAKLDYNNTYWLDFVVSKNSGDINSNGDFFHAATGI